MTSSSFVRRLSEYIDRHALFPRDAKVVVGVSGGADSIALIQAMVRLNLEQGYKLKLHIAHLNHCLRKEESDSDA